MRIMKSFPEYPELVFSFFLAIILMVFAGVTILTVTKDRPREIQISKCASSLFEVKKTTLFNNTIPITQSSSNNNLFAIIKPNNLKLQS